MPLRLLAPNSRQQLLDAFDQALDGKRFDQVFHVLADEEVGDLWVARETGDENEAIRERWTHCLGLEIKLVTAQAWHLQIANDGVVLVDFHLEQGLLAIKSDIHQEIFVSQDPLQCRSKLLVVIHQEDGLQFERVDRLLGFVAVAFKLHGQVSSADVVPIYQLERQLPALSGVE